MFNICLAQLGWVVWSFSISECGICCHDTSDERTYRLDLWFRYKATISVGGLKKLFYKAVLAK